MSQRFEPGSAIQQTRIQNLMDPSTTMTDSGVLGIQLTYSVPDHSRDGTSKNKSTTAATIVHQKHFSASQLPPATMGLPHHEIPNKPEPGSYQYSGVHDGGPLVPPKEGGAIAQLIAAIQHAKAYSDTYLTELIEREEQQPQSNATVDNTSINETGKKRARTGNL